MTVETFFANFGYLADAPNGVQKLRELILQLAVQGKLVPQDPKDEPASVLLEKIESEKERLLKEGRLKKGRKLPELDGEPYELPVGWQWARLNDVYDVRDGTHDSPKYVSKGFPLVTSKNLSSGRLDLSGAKFISEADHLKIQDRSKVDQFDILFAMIGSIGNPVIVDIETDFSIKNVALFKYYSLDLSEPKYLCQYLVNVSNEMRTKSAGGVQSFVSLGFLRGYPFPLPPLEEQKRIVAKVDQLMALCDELETRQKKQQQGRVRLNNAALDALFTAREPDEFADLWQRISTNLDLLYDHPQTIAKLRAAILQLAVQGKLVPQNPNDEPASVLLERIRTEKERLVKEGKIKKQKPLPSLDMKLAPFDLPFGWAWARFPDVGEFGRGKSKHRPRNDPSLYSGGKYPMVQTGDVARANGEVRTYTALYNEAGLAQSRMWPKGTMCITIAANIADSAVLGFDACFPDSVVGLIASEEIGDVAYFEYFIRTAKGHLMDFAPSTAQKNINLGILETVFIPLPPLAEMKRIVAKVEQLMALCYELEAKLNQAQHHSEKLMEATVRQLLVA